MRLNDTEVRQPPKVSKQLPENRRIHGNTHWLALGLARQPGDGGTIELPPWIFPGIAGKELVNNYGFKKLPVSDPYEAPVGAVLVYGAKSAAGHVEIRTEDGFVSDFRSKIPSRRPLIGVFAKT